MPKTGAGPGGRGTVNLDSYQQDSPPPAPVTTTAVKIIVPTDKKTGPAKPASLGGPSSTTGCPDDFWE
jgi:hypothetical protein